ncbi:amidohydrolase family protein [Steroidobacter sp.]|uniref:amidohydrolase family protein n=1 Tax=Steroidobacter sp. TaxID=1978227 RepID=UPI001A530961|nr:amidohydrolase family protein [Steroidobacter sp.]MBL8266810.1 amidohydrolase family protein [Steroidobacter sp.]
MGVDSLEHDVGFPQTLMQADQSSEKASWFNCAPPGSPRWREVITRLVNSHVVSVPTFAILEAHRDFMRVSRGEWLDEYVMPELLLAFQPNAKAHGSSNLNATTTSEVLYKNRIRLAMQFVNDFKSAGGRVAVGSDAGFIYQLYGFGFVRELEMLQEAGFTPLEVVTAATRNGAKLVKLGDETGTVEAGKKADLVLIAENPLDNFKVLYGTGYEHYDAQLGEVQHRGRVRYTIRDGIVWDAGALLADVRSQVAEAKRRGQRP